MFNSILVLIITLGTLTAKAQMMGQNQWGSTGYAGGTSSGVYSGYNGPGTPVYSTYGTSR